MPSGLDLMYVTRALGVVKLGFVVGAKPLDTRARSIIFIAVCTSGLTIDALPDVCASPVKPATVTFRETIRWGQPVHTSTKRKSKAIRIGVPNNRAHSRRAGGPGLTRERRPGVAWSA